MTPDEYEARLRDAVQDAAERFVHVAEWRMAEAAAEVTA